VFAGESVKAKKFAEWLDGSPGVVHNFASLLLTEVMLVVDDL
jgi:hypothetical protein